MAEANQKERTHYREDLSRSTRPTKKPRIETSRRSVMAPSIIPQAVTLPHNSLRGAEERTINRPIEGATTVNPTTGIAASLGAVPTGREPRAHSTQGAYMSHTYTEAFRQHHFRPGFIRLHMDDCDRTLERFGADPHDRQSSQAVSTNISADVCHLRSHEHDSRRSIRESQSYQPGNVLQLSHGRNTEQFEQRLRAEEHSG